MRELDSNARRLLLLGFLLFTLLWRVATTSDSVWLEGHFASYLVLVLPWTLFSTHSQSENGKRFFLFLYTVLFIVWFLGPSFDFKLSFYASDLSNRYGFPGLVAPVAALMAFFLTVSRHLFFRIYFFLSSAFMSLGILLISNRASALASMACVIMYVVLSPVSIALRVIGLFLSVIAVAMASWYAPLADRFRNMASEGSGKERLELWRVAWELTLENPWFGVGPGQFPNLVRSRSTQIDAQLDVHNSWLEVLCETGIPGVFFFSLFWLIVVIASFISFFRSRRVIDNTQEIESPRSLGDPSTWLFRSTWVFVCVYFVVGFFGSRHNLPLAYLLAGVGLSACLNAGSKPLRPDALDYAATA
jgi:O-antigen ligase